MNSFTPEIIYCHGNRREALNCSGQANPIDLEWLELHDSIVSGREPYANGRYGQRIVTLLEAIKHSSDSAQSIKFKESLG